MSRTALGLGLVLALSAAPAFGQEAWEERFFNPEPAQGDFILPLPCGGSMAFRKVEIAGAGPLDDMRVELGLADPALGVLDDRRFENIAGAFTPPDQVGARFYYIGKYEVTQSQFDVFADQCPSVSMAGRQPVTDVSWFDAQRYAQNLTEWLLQSARDSLPREGELSGFLRLPTEAEWEFAARGGMAVSNLDFVAGLYPMPEGTPAAYIWYQGSQSAGGRLHPTGLLKPNPLGLYDILGNASEMIFEPFRLNRRGRLHGQAGGFVTRGGDFTVPLETINSAARVELPYYSERTGTATTLRQLGFRLVIAAPAIVSAQRLEELEADYEALPQADPGEETATLEADAMAALGDVARDTADVALRTRLQGALANLETAIAERNEARDRTLRSLINLGGFFGYRLRTDHVRLDIVNRTIDEVAIPTLAEMRERSNGSPEAVAAIAQAEAQIAEMNAQREQLRATARRALENYADAVFALAGDYSLPLIQAQAPPLLSELGARNAVEIVPYVELFLKHLEDLDRNEVVDPEQWLEDLTR